MIHNELIIWYASCREAMRALVDKFQGGYEAWAEEHGEELIV